MTRTSYKLTKSTTKTEKFEKSLKIYIIINSKTICSKLTGSGNIIHLFGNYIFMSTVSILRLPRERKKAIKQTEKKYARKLSRLLENALFSKIFIILNFF